MLPLMVMRYIRADAMHPCANGKVGWRLLTVGWRSLQAGVNKPIWNQKKKWQKKKNVPTWVCETFSWCSRCVFQAWRIHSRWFGVNTCVYVQRKHRRAPLLRHRSEELKWFRWLIDALLRCCEFSIDGQSERSSRRSTLSSITVQEASQLWSDGWNCRQT